jgi:hypothetical protein
MAAGGFRRATSVVVAGAHHDVGDSHDNLLRELLAAFFRDPSCFSAATLEGLRYGQCRATALAALEPGGGGEGGEGAGDGADEAPGRPELVLCEGQAEAQQDAGGWEEKLASSCRALPIGQGCSRGAASGSGRLRYGLVHGAVPHYGRVAVVAGGWSLAQMALLALCLLMVAQALRRLYWGSAPPRPPSPNPRRNAAVLRVY